MLTTFSEMECSGTTVWGTSARATFSETLDYCSGNPEYYLSKEAATILCTQNCDFATLSADDYK